MLLRMLLTGGRENNLVGYSLKTPNAASMPLTIVYGATATSLRPSFNGRKAMGAITFSRANQADIAYPCMPHISCDDIHRSYACAGFAIAIVTFSCVRCRYHSLKLRSVISKFQRLILRSSAEIKCSPSLFGSTEFT